MRLLFLAFALKACFTLSTCSRLTFPSDVTAGPPSPIFQFGSAVEIEDLVVRPNGKILFTTPSPAAEVWQINPFQANGSAEIIAQFNRTSALGITQVDIDVFAVSTGNIGPGFSGVVGSFAIHLLDFTHGRVAIGQSIDVPDAKFLNKLTMLDSPSPILLASDSQRGLVYGIHLASGSAQPLLQDHATMNATPSFPNGINGIQRVGRFIYYTNSSKGLFCRVGLHPNGTTAGPFEIVANVSNAVPLPDGFTVLPDDRAFVAGSNQVLYIRADGRYNVFDGGVNRKELAGVTSAQFGVDSNATTLFLTTSGHISEPATISFNEPGKVISVDVHGL
ncbi:hypothetical protein N7474_008583 [Penicillium riverlandense]|uniref:uncharacterized protein n=1 Tax=Penicillium riverlandense TaxID=1903569 RepID=UPI002547B909|nr:uncharacterized protein N7474_008583 [Penicillium riverlandense]KAJ5812282.1 hypothetical protein N7474_008583 [Penicillium riverlandense]